MAAFLYRMGNAIPGDYNREAAGGTIESAAADPLNPIPAYGLPVALNASGNGMRPIGASDTAATLYGVVLRPFPYQSQSPGTFGAQQLLTTSPVPPTAGMLDIMRRGYCGVAVNSGASGAIQKGSPVYIWIAATTTGHTQGGFEGAASGGSTIAAPATFMGPVDSNGATEIAWNI